MDASVLTLPGGDEASFQDGGTETEAFLGLKVGIRRPHYGVFFKVRPGLVTCGDTLDTEFQTNNPYVRNVNFVLDQGAVVEVYPRAGHFVMRFDLGDVANVLCGGEGGYALRGGDAALGSRAGGALYVWGGVAVLRGGSGDAFVPINGQAYLRG